MARRRAYAAERDYPLARRAVTSPHYFDTFGVSVLQGRDFGPQDQAGSLPVTIVNRSFAQARRASTGRWRRWTSGS